MLKNTLMSPSRRELFYLIKYPVKKTIVGIVSAIEVEIWIIQKFVEISFYVCFCLLPGNLVHDYEIFFQFALFKSIVSLHIQNLSTTPSH